MPIDLSAASKADHAQTRALLPSHAEVFTSCGGWAAQRDGQGPEVIEQGPLVSVVKNLEFGFAAGIVLVLMVFAFASAGPTQFGSLRTAMGVGVNDSARSVDGVTKVARAASLDDYLSAGP